MRRPITLVFLGATLLAAACTSGYGRGEAVDDLRDSGMTEDEATCVADEMEAREIDFQEANESDTDSELFDEIVEIAVDCGAASSESDAGDDGGADGDAEADTEGDEGGG